MKKYFFLILIFFAARVSAQELRATWIARNDLSSKEALVQAIDSLAKANFNVVYINVWSRGYPLWQSDLFYKETGYKIDPTYGSRDILAEAIAEGHRHGMHVEAWFEYGFVGGWTGNQPAGQKGPIFKNHPDWVAKRKDGGEKDNSNFYWMAHTRKDVQNFLIGLAAEICRKYDVDGIELDRIRYSSLEYGYDSYTDSLYRSEHNGAALPSVTSDEKWIRWRADKLNGFMKAIYDTIKSINPNVNVSNAPSLYGTYYTSYYSFCQDWFWWVNNNVIDNVQVQSYVTSPKSFSGILDYINQQISNKSKIFPAFAISPNGNDIVKDTLLRFFEVTKSKGFSGNSIWFYTDLKPYFTWLRNTAYRQPAYPPFSPADWREYHKVVEISNQNDAVRFGSWANSNSYGLNGPSIYTSSTDSASVEYFVDVPADGYYEVYAFIIPVVNRLTNAEYSVTDSSSTLRKVIVDQTDPNNRRWYKLGDFFLKKGRRGVVKVSNHGIASGKAVGADAVMISLNRSLSPDVTTSVEQSGEKKKAIGYKFELKNYPNPFNSSTKISFRLNSERPYELLICNLLGEKVFSLFGTDGKIGENTISFNFDKLPSGIYLCSLLQDNAKETIKIVLTK